MEHAVNTTGCPPGFATDEIMLYDNAPMSCDMSVGVYIFIGVAIIALKIMNTAGHMHLYYLREKANKDKPHRRQKKRRIPLVPLFSFIMLINYICVFVLTWLNIANAKNGLPAFFFGIGYLIIPSRARALAKNTGDEVNRLDFRGKVSMSLALLALVGQAILLCIVGLVMPNDYDILRIAYGFHAWFSTQHGLSMVIQFERIKRAIRTARDANVSSNATRDLNVVLRKLTEQEIVVALANAFSVAFYIGLCTKAYETRYFVFPMVMWVENLNFLLILLSNYKAKRKPKSQLDGSSLNNNNTTSGKAEVNKKLTAEARADRVVAPEEGALPLSVSKNTNAALPFAPLGSSSPKEKRDGSDAKRMQSGYAEPHQVAAYMSNEDEPSDTGLATDTEKQAVAENQPLL